MVNSLETKSKDRAVLGCPTRAQDGHGFLMEEDPILVPERKEKSDLSQLFQERAIT